MLSYGRSPKSKKAVYKLSVAMEYNRTYHITKMFANELSHEFETKLADNIIFSRYKSKG